MTRVVVLIGLFASVLAIAHLGSEVAATQNGMRLAAGAKPSSRQRTQVYFKSPAGMKVYWLTQGKNGKDVFSTTPLEVPGRYNFIQGAIYRLKLTHVSKDRPGLELFPTLEVALSNPKTSEYLAHNSVPLEFTDEDFKHVIDGNFLVKVIYLPAPQFQDAGPGADEISSSRLKPGQNPVQEAQRRGSILLVVRIGNIDQQVGK